MSSALEPDVLSPSRSQKRQLAFVTFGFLAVLGALFTLWPREVFSRAYLPHIYCYLDKPGLIWTHVIADTLVGLSYVTISITLAYLVSRGRRDIPFHWMFLAFGLFIIACGATHFVEVVTIWIPIYVFSAGVKVFTAVASLATAVVLPTQVPKILALIREAHEATEYRRALEKALLERDEAQIALKTANRQLEHQVEERTAQLRDLAAIVESSDDAIIGKDLEGVITSWNQGAERIYGYKGEEVLGCQVSRNVPEDRIQELHEIMVRVARGERIEQLETKRITKDGRVLDVSLTISPIRNVSGSITGASAIGRDISRAKRAEDALRKSEEQYRLLFDHNPLPMWVFDRKTLSFLAVNEAAISHYGYSREEFARLTILDIRPTTDIPGLLKDLSQPVPGLQDAKVWRHRIKDGSVIQVEITAHELDFEGHEAELVLANDITERTNSEERLHQSQEKFAKAFRASPFGISISTESEGRYVDANPAFLTMMGYELDEMVGRTSGDLEVWADPHQRDEMLRQLNTGNTVKQIEARFRTHAGEIRLVQVAAERIALDSKPCVLAIMQDVTDSRRLEQQFRQSQKMEAIGRLAGGIAHDFNNMLGVIIGYSEIAQDNLSETHPAKKHIEQIKLAGNRAASLTRQLLAFSRQQVLEPKILNLNTAVKNMTRMLSRMIGENIELVVKPAEPLGNVQADLGQIEQVLMNLSVNARDAMPKGGKLVIETANVDLDKSYAQQHQSVVPGPYVMLTVSDTGVGMDPSVMNQIFEPFFTTKGPNEGTGLGLSTVYGIVKQSGGYIWVYSETNKGSTFKIYLPRVGKPAESSASGKETAAARGTETILIVEDDPTLRMLTVELLEGSGYVLLQAENGITALELARNYQGTIELVVTDVIMPGMSGPDMADELHKLQPATKVLYISGYTGEFAAHQGVLGMGAPLLSKPFSRNSLLSKVRSVLDEKADTPGAGQKT
jgi:PAS domain S-box-containing protein